MNYRLKTIEEMDACVFSSDMLYNDEERKHFKAMVARWARALNETENVAPPQRERIMCGCGDQIMPDDGAECGTCVTARNATQREWQGLTDEEMMVAAFQAGFDVHEDYDNEDDPDALHWWSEDGEQCDDTLHKLRDIIEAKLKEKNT